MNNYLTKWFKNKREKWFHCNEKKTIDCLLEESFIARTHSAETKKKFINKAIDALITYKKDEDFNWQLYFLGYETRKSLNNNLADDADEKMQSVVSILSERKKNIITKQNNFAAWTGIGVSLLLGVIGTFLSIDCSNTKLNDEQFKEIKESIEKSKPTDIRISDDAINTIRKQETKK
jgi:hypothetical protein